MRRLGRWMRRGFTAVGALAVIVIVLLLVVGNPFTGGGSPVANALPGGGGKSSDGDKSKPSEQYGFENTDNRTVAEQREDAREAAEQYREFEATQSGDRAAQAKLDRPLLRLIISSRWDLDRCGREHANYGMPDFTSCAAVISEPTLQVAVFPDGYEISGNAGAATFIDHMELQVHKTTCNLPETGACSASGTWVLG